MIFKVISIVLVVAIIAIFVSNNSTKVDSEHATEVEMSDEEGFEELTDLQYEVTQEGKTERAFDNEYWDNKEPGIYLDVVSKKPIFSSLDKYDSGTGWPSFSRPIDEALIIHEEDNSLGVKRTEVKTNDSHLGHVFDDGPIEDGGARFCINSAAMEFVHYKDLEARGFGEYVKLFEFEEAYLAGGCFWGVEKLLQDQEGIANAVSGYTGGDVENPTYKQVVTGDTGHAEAVRIEFDPEVISYAEVLDIFWRLHDPTQLNKQGWDRGTQYRSAIFYVDEEQKKIAEESKAAFDAKGVFSKPAVTEITEFDVFYPAEEYHQDYNEKNPSYVCHVLRDE